MGDSSGAGGGSGASSGSRGHWGSYGGNRSHGGSSLSRPGESRLSDEEMVRIV
jgi:hypothetical protein